MSDPGKVNIPWKRVWQINLRFLGGAIAFFYGWLCWQGASPTWWGLWLIGAVGLVGGGLRIVVTLFEVFGLILSLRPWRKITDKAAKPKADPKPVRDTMKDGGMLR